MVEPFTVYRRLAATIRATLEMDGHDEEKTGSELLAIAHNGNLSNGRMFPIIESFTGNKIDRAYAESRADGSRSTK